MAAAEYYTGATRPPTNQNSSNLFPPPHGPQRASSNPSLSQYALPPDSYAAQGQHQYPQQYPPPPYNPADQGQKPSVHFAQTPSPLNQTRPANHSPSRPEPYIFNQPNHQVPHNQHLAPSQHQYVPQNYQPQILPQGYPNQPRPHRTYSDLSRPAGGYVSDPERHRRKHKDRPRRISDTSRSTNADGFLGAAGGGLIGDLIFPGLGTVGGAVVGWIGGKDYGKHRKWREEKRDREQERWERKYRSSSDRSRSHSRERKRDHDRRKSRE